jgi:AmiR/NasT family two-component response regulator
MTQILVVEDEGIIALDLQAQLKSLGYDVLGRAASGREAIEKVVTRQPDLVLMDIRLKGNSDGVDIAQEIREQFNIPVIYMTASNDEETLQRAMVTEPFGYLVKPVEATTLYASIEMALHKHKVEETLRESYEELKRQVEDRAAELSRANRLLRREVAERRQIEKALRKAREDLEKRVEERTLDLRRANERLLSEIAERKQAESAEREQRTLAEALREAAVTFSSAFNLDEVLEHILDSISIVVPHDAAVIALTESEADHIVQYR